MKPHEHPSMLAGTVPSSELPMTPVAAELIEQASDMVDVQAHFDALLAKIVSEALDEGEVLDQLYRAKESTFNGREYGVYSKIADEIEKRETAAA